MATVAAAGQVTFMSAYLNPLEPLHIMFPWYREFAPINVVNCPVPSKYNLLFVPNVMTYCVEAALKVGVARKSAITAAAIFVAAV